MNPLFRTLIEKFPNFVNIIPERFVDSEEISLAIEKNYEINESTPTYLLKNPKIARAFLDKYESVITSGSRILSYQELTNLLSNKDIAPTIIKDSYINLSNYTEEEQNNLINTIIEIFKETSKTLNSLRYFRFDEIKYLLKSSKLFAYAYFKENINRMDALVEIFSDYEEIYNIIQENIATFEFDKITLPLFDVWFNHDKSIILNKKLSYTITTSPDFLKYVEESGYGIESFLNQNNQINNSNVAIYFLQKDFSNIQYLPRIQFNYKYEEEIIKEFLKDIDNNIKYVEQLSAVIDETHLSDQDKELILNTLKKNQVYLDNCRWQFIRDDIDYLYDNLISNPKSIVTWENINLYKLTKEQKNNIIEMINNGQIVINEMIPLFNSEPEIFRAALRINPYIIENDNKYVNMSSYNVPIDFLMECGYKFSLQTPGSIFYGNPKIVLEELKTNIELINHPSFNVNNNTDEEVEEVYNILKSHFYTLTPSSPKALLSNPLLLLDALKNNTIDLQFLSNTTPNRFIKTTKELFEYLLANYPENQIPVPYNYYLDNYGYYYEVDEKAEKILIDLQMDFKNCLNYKKDTTLNENLQKQISELYLANYEENKKYYDECEFLQYNPFINLYECFRNNKTFNVTDNIPDEVRNEFINNYLQYNIPFHKEYMKLFSYRLELKDLIKNNPMLIDYVGKYELSSLKDIIIESLENGTYHLNPNSSSELFDVIIDYCIENNVPNMEFLFKTDGYYYSFSKIKPKLIDLLKNNRLNVYFLPTKTIEQLTLEEFYEIATLNNDILALAHLKSKDNQPFNSYEPIKNLLSLTTTISPYNITREYTHEEYMYLAQKDFRLLLNSDFIYDLAPSDEEWELLHNILVEKIKSNPEIITGSPSNINLLIKKNSKEIDYSIINLIFEKNQDLAISCLRYDLKREYFNKVVETFINSDNDKQEAIISHLPKELARELLLTHGRKELCIKCQNLLPEDFVREIYFSDGIDLTSNLKYLRNNQIKVELLRNDIKNAKYMHIYYREGMPESIVDEIYNIFVAHENEINIYEYSIFYNNPKIAEKYLKNKEYVESHFILNENSEIFFDDLDNQEKLRYATISLNQNPSSFVFLMGYYQDIAIAYLENHDIEITKEIYEMSVGRKIFKKLLEKYPKEMLSLLEDNGLSTIKENDLISLIDTYDITLTENTPNVLKSNKNVILNTLKKNPSSIVYANCDVEFTELEQQEIIKILLDNQIYFYPNAFLFLRKDFDYLLTSVKKNPSCIDYLSVSRLDSYELHEIITSVKEHINSNKYSIKENIPKWLLLDEEIRTEYIKLYPEKATRLTEYEYLYQNNIITDNNPYKIIENLINNISLVDKINLDNNTIYPTNLINTLVDKLISSYYVVSDKTPEVLLNNEKLIHYALKNNYHIPTYYIESFITFENMYKLQDKSLFKKYIEQGYGKKYQSYYDKFGIDNVIELALKYGYLLYKESIENLDNIDEIRTKIQKHIQSITDSSTLLDYIIRTEYEITDEELIHGIGNNYYSINISKNDQIFKYLLKTNPEKIIFYQGDNNVIYELAFAHGYTLTNEEYQKNKNFHTSTYISKKALDLDLSNIYYYKGEDESLYTYAIEKGYIPSYEKVSYNEYMCKSATIIRTGMQEDLNFAFLYTGLSIYLEDIFEIKNKNNETLLPTKENISRLSFLHDNDKLMTFAINYDKDNVIFYQGYNEEVYETAIKKGYIPTKADFLQNEFLSRSNTIIQKAIEEDINNVVYFKGNIEDISNIFEIQDKNGNKFIATKENMDLFTIIYFNDELMKKAISQNAKNIVYYTGNNEEIFAYSLSLGYKPTIEDFEVSSSLSSSTSMYEYILNSNDESLIPILVYYTGMDDTLIDKIYRILLKEKYSEIIATPQDIQNYASIWKSFNDQIDHQNLLSYMNVSNIQAFSNMKIDYYLVLKYGLKNPKMLEYVKIINNKELDNFVALYNNITENYIEYNNNAFGVDLFLKIARFYNNYQELSIDILNNKLNDNEVANLMKLINSNIIVPNINKVSDLENTDNLLKEDISSILEKDITDPKEIKNAILKYVFDIEYDEFKHILENYINYDTLDQILAKCTNKTSELYIEASMLRTMFKMLEETINATNDIDALKSLLKNYLDNSELVDKTRPLFYDLKERIRNVYELDANTSLIDLKDPNLPKRQSIHDPNLNIIELENSEYVMYAHVVCGTNYEEYVNYRFNGKVTICVSPISNIGKKLYSNNGVILGFTEVPRGGFIGSSNRNMGSNGYINPNDYEVYRDHYYHLEIRNSSSLTPANHPETLLYRDGLIPSCIIIRGNEPSTEELEAQRIFTEILRREKGYGDDYTFPLVHTQAIGNVAELKQQEDVCIIEGEQEETKKEFLDTEINLGTYQAKLDKLSEIREEIMSIRNRVESLQIKKSPVYDIIPMKIGGSHEMFKCHLTDRPGVYYLKPGYRKDGGAVDPYRSYAMETAYHIQSIVNPENAVYSETFEVPFTDLGKDKEGSVLCSVIEVIPDTTSYEGWKSSPTYQELSEKEMDFFICEYISDYLLFSYDTKGENFLKDKNGNPYGIDKEQALKFILHPSFITRDEDGHIESFDTSLDTSNAFDPNSCGIMYPYIFDKILSGAQTITEGNYKKGLEAISRIESISDEEYKNIYRKYVEDFSTSNVVRDIKEKYIQSGMSEEEAINMVREELYSSILARKNNLRKEFTTYFNNLITESYKIAGKEVPEWIKQDSLSI